MERMERMENVKKIEKTESLIGFNRISGLPAI
jgi:hypothetical protein